MGYHFPLPGDQANPGIKPVSPVSPELQKDSLPAVPLGKPFGQTLVYVKKKHLVNIHCHYICHINGYIVLFLLYILNSLFKTCNIVTWDKYG